MNLRYIGGNYFPVAREGDGGGGGGGGDALPWAGSNGARWDIGGAPWYDAAVTGDDEVSRGARDYLRAKNYADPGVAARSLYELQRSNEHLKANAITIPGEGASPEEWSAYYRKLGRPDNVEGYKDVKWGDKADPAMVDFAKQLAYDLGISPKMAEGVMAKRWNEFAAGIAEKAETEAKAQQEQYLATLKTEMGAAFEQNLAQGQRVMETLKKNGMSEDDFAAIEGAMGVPQLVRMLTTLGKLTSEGGFMTGTGGGADIGDMTPEAAKAKFEGNMADAEFAKKYTNKDHPEHKQSVALMEALAARAGNLL